MIPSWIYLKKDTSRIVRTNANGKPTIADTIQVHALRLTKTPAEPKSRDTLSPAKIIYSVGVKSSNSIENTIPTMRPGRPNVTRPISGNPESL